MIRLIYSDVSLLLLFPSESGNMYLTKQGIPHEDTMDLWINIIGLGVMFLVFMTLTYIRLRLIKNHT